MNFRSTVLAVLPFLAAVALCAADPAPAPQPAPPEVAALAGKWWGEARRGDERVEIGFEFRQAKDGRVLAILWLPAMNTFGSPVGWVASQDGAFVSAEAGMKFARSGDGLAGTELFGAPLAYTLQPAAGLPKEPPPPADLPTGPEPAWTYEGGAAFWTTPVVADGVIFAGDQKGVLHAVTAADGAPRWKFDAGAAIHGEAAVADGAVYFATDDGLLHKLDAATGAPRWRAEIGGAGKRSVPDEHGGEWDFTNAAPVVAGDQVFIGSGDGTVRAFRAATGEPVWSFKTGDRVRGAVAVTADRVFAGSFDHFVYALDRSTGALAWKFDTGSAVTTAPVVAAGRVIIGTRDRALLYGLDERTGEKAWEQFWWYSWIESSPAVVDGVAYIGSSDSRHVRAFDPRTGAVTWTTQVWGWTWGTPLVAGDTVYFATAGAAQYFVTQRASLGALDRATGALRWRKPLELQPGRYFTGSAGGLATDGTRFIVPGLDGRLRAYPLGR